jgi:hypothetical protein
MAQQQQNITISAPGFQGLNLEDSPLNQDPSFCAEATNAVVDSFGRIGARKAWAEYTTAINVTITSNVDTDYTKYDVHTIGEGVVDGTRVVLCSVSALSYDAEDTLIESDYFVCIVDEPSAEVWELDELTITPSDITTPAMLTDCQFVSFNDKMYVFSKGNECLVYDGSSAALTPLFDGTIDVDYIAPSQVSAGDIATAIDGDVACAAFGRLWVSGVNGDYETIYWSDLLIATQWFDGREPPEDTQNTAGIIDVSQYWPNGSDRIVGIVAHNNFLYVMGRQSILIYTGMAGDPAALEGATLQDTVVGLGLVNRDAVVNIGSDVVFVDDTGVRSMGRTIQEKSVPIGDLSYNVRTEVSSLIAETTDKTTISLDYWPDESLLVLLFANSGLSYVMEMRAPAQNGGLKVTKWTDCRFNRSCYFEDDANVRILLAANQDNKGLLQYDSYLQYDGEPYEFEYISNPLTFGQPANDKFLKQIDYTVVATNNVAEGQGSWRFLASDRTYRKLFSIIASEPALYGVAQFSVGKFGPGLQTTKRYRVNTQGRGEAVSIGFKADIEGNNCSLQELNIQTLLGRIN